VNALALQTVLARLVVEPDVRDAVRADAAALPAALTPIERSRLVRIAACLEDAPAGELFVPARSAGVLRGRGSARRA